MNIPKTRIILRILGLIIVALLIWVKSQPTLKPLNRHNVSTTLLGYTNDGSGTRLARIAITNLSALVVYVYHPVIETPAATEWVGVEVYPPGQEYYHSDYFRWHAMLDSGASASFTVPVLTNQPSWRLGLYADADVGTARAIVRTVEAFPSFRHAARRMPYDIESDWIEIKK